MPCPSFWGERVGRETDPFYSTGAWKRIRRRALDRDHGYCVWCRRAGRKTIDRSGRPVPVRATMVHHIKPRREYPELALTLDNLVSLCDACHDEAHPEKHGQEKREQQPTAAQLLGVTFVQL